MSDSLSELPFDWNTESQSILMNIFGKTFQEKVLVIFY